MDSSSHIEVAHERKALNEHIEDVFIECSNLSAIILTHFMTGNGVVLKLFEDYYGNLSLLYLLTSGLSGMDETSDACKKLREWIHLGGIKAGSDKELKTRFQMGFDAFLLYKSSLMQNGIIKV